MSVAPPEFPEAVTPTAADTELARESGRKLAQLTEADQGRVRVNINVAGTEESIAIPSSAFRLLTDILNQMSLGNAITLIPVHAELTTQQAADILNVSRPYVIKLTEEGSLPCRKVGNHRRILFSALMDYKRLANAESMKALDELSAQAQELKLGYGP